MGVISIAGCGGEKKNQNESVKPDSLSRPESINIVSAIAKVEPSNGFVELSSDVSGIVVERYKKEGDTIKKGDPIFRLDKQIESLQVASARQEINAQNARVEASKADIIQYEASLREKEEDLTITKRLAATGADTRQNVAVKEKERDVIIANLQSSRAKLEVAQSDLINARNNLKQTELGAQSRVISSKESGILVSMNVGLGAAIAAFQPYATLVPLDDLVLHGEIDEMFATRVKAGQHVDVNYVGYSNIIAQGTIIYLSPILDSKSLFYESTGESTDRRVRKFKASFKSNEPLLINAKVECKIKIQ